MNTIGGEEVAASAGSAQGHIYGNMDTLHLSSLTGVPLQSATLGGYHLQNSTHYLLILGSGFTYDSNNRILTGSPQYFTYIEPTHEVSLALPGASASFGAWIAADATQAAFTNLLANNDRFNGGNGADLLRGYAGDDSIFGSGGGDSLFGGEGNDTLFAGVPSSRTGGGPDKTSFLRGEEGDDSLVGGGQFDDIHGNMGNDTERGGDGFDWVVGGQGNDLLYGEAGGDIVYGNLGADTCLGGDGVDWVRGGQANDSLDGGAGDDWLWGDRGDDTVTGGAGADIFHTLPGAGLDRVTDFTYAEGDRVIVDQGAYTVSQVGGDTVVDLGGGDRMVLTGVTLASLPQGWITGL